jgi:hypothetical protein
MLRSRWALRHDECLEFTDDAARQAAKHQCREWPHHEPDPAVARCEATFHRYRSCIVGERFRRPPAGRRGERARRPFERIRERHARGVFREVLHRVGVTHERLWQRAGPHSTDPHGFGVAATLTDARGPTVLCPKIAQHPPDRSIRSSDSPAHCESQPPPGEYATKGFRAIALYHSILLLGFSQSSARNPTSRQFTRGLAGRRLASEPASRPRSDAGRLTVVGQ